MEIADIHKAFYPSIEISDPMMFAGRRPEIKNALLALQNDGGFLAIYGPRGVGKSSIALQVKLIAENNFILPHSLNLSKFLPKKGFNYQVFYIKCDKFITNTHDLIKRLLFGDENNPSLFSLTSSGDKKLESFRRIYEGEAGLGLFGSKLGGKTRKEEQYSTYISDDFIQLFRNILGSVRNNRVNEGKNKLFILIDEFDLIEDKAGFASIVKACSSEFIKFGIVGISYSLGELMQEHGSIGRQIDTIPVSKMKRDELQAILSKAEYKLKNKIRFDQDAKDIIVQYAEGFPYFIHLLGKEALLTAYERDINVITHSTIDETIQSFVNGKLPTIYEEVYYSSIQSSKDQEIVLKALAEYQQEEISIDETHKMLVELGIKFPTQIVENLCKGTSKSDPVLYRIRSGYFRFSDPIFKIYAKLRKWLF